MAAPTQHELFSIIKLFNSGTIYQIPIYQRNFAWGYNEISQLIMDIQKMAERNKDQPYYIGTLVTWKGEGGYEVIDGQQRLTCLYLCLCAIHHLKGTEGLPDYQDKLTFKARPGAQQALKAIAGGDTTIVTENAELVVGFNIVKEKIGEVDKQETFIKYFLEQVIIVRTEVPQDTDLNLYFEAMNTRGLQLEQHHIVKARLLSLLDGDYRLSAAEIWDACADMGQRIEMNFHKDRRKEIFHYSDKSNSPKLLIHEGGAVTADGTAEVLVTTPPINIGDIIGKPSENENDTNNRNNEEDPEDKFDSIIDFPNFLLHVLRIHQGIDAKISLDDKTLIESFELIKNSAAASYFFNTLLTCRWLFDTYIIKRDRAGDAASWSISRGIVYIKEDVKNDTYNHKNTFEYNEESEKLRMIQTMLHAAFPTRNNKNWLYEALEWLHGKVRNSINAGDYLGHLERWCKNNIIGLADKDVNLRYGAVTRFHFFYLDYLIWKNMVLPVDPKGQTAQALDFPSNAEENVKRANEKVIEIITNKMKAFHFSASNSIEHYQPQHGLGDNSAWTKEANPPLHSFGNLCLISGGLNSKLSNHSPTDKRDHFLSDGIQLPSLKLALMMSYQLWNPDLCKDHEKAMIRLFNEEAERLATIENQTA